MEVFESQDNSGDGAIDAARERAALSRLKVAADLSGGTPVRELGRTIESRFGGWWFLIRLWRWTVRIADAVLLTGDFNTGIAGAIEQFMNRVDVDVARFAVVRSSRTIGRLVVEARKGSRLWIARTGNENPDVLQIVTGGEGALGQLGRQVRRNARRSDRIAAALGLEVELQFRTKAIEASAAVAALATRNRPHPVDMKDVAALESLMEDRPHGFESRVTLRSGTLVSLIRGYLQGPTAFLVYQLNDPILPRINLALFHQLKLADELARRDVSEIVFVSGASGLIRAACRTSAEEEIVTVRSSLRGLLTATVFAIALRGTRFGDGVQAALLSMVRHWARQPARALDWVKRVLTPAPGRGWTYALASLVGLVVSAVAVGAGILLRAKIGAVPYLTAYPALLIATYLSGTWTGLLTLAMGGIGMLYFVIPPYNTFILQDERDVWATVIYLVTAPLLWRWLSRHRSFPRRA